jgi:antitoxin HicB
MMSKKHIGSTLDSFLDEMQIREETKLLAIKRTVALQLSQAMKRKRVSQSHLAKDMRTSRTLINRMLDPTDTGVTLATLARASQVLGLRLDIRLAEVADPRHKNRFDRRVHNAIGP